ncbi:MAG: hypothetical protein LQ342_005150 [Letrouitia transgressa]|nr:MAG: hypothetical protein LQ342_005150 [Letrouitia transgressa]
MQRLSLGTPTTTTTTPSLSSSSQSIHRKEGEPASPADPTKTTIKSLRRTPSSTSISHAERTPTPILQKRSSYSTLQGKPDAVTSPRSPALRRTSSNLASSPLGTGTRAMLSAPAEEPAVAPAATAASVAKEFFGKELRIHEEGSKLPRDHHTVVILQDDCYGHRYSRPRTSKASLSTIVERPERIQASVLGVAAAYIRLGGRHAEAHMGPSPKRKIGSLSSMPFRIHKTKRRVPLDSPAVTTVHGSQWMTELGSMCDAAEANLAINGRELTRPPPIGQSSLKETTQKPKLHEGDLYLCSGSLNALEGSLGGVCEAVDTVFQEEGPKRAFVCIRPPGHHCSAELPSGFCWLNNVHVGIHHATMTHGLTHAAIIDFDLHHGDGSQAITWAHNSRVSKLPKNTPSSKKTAIGYFSLHDINSYPCETGEEEKVRSASLCLEDAHGQTVWNVHLQPWKTDKEFWDLYQKKYMTLLEKAKRFLRVHTDRLRQAPLHPQPKAAIFLSAGFDASEWESSGMQRHQVNVPTDFYAQFTHDIVQMANEEGLGVNGRVVSVLEGGYSDRALMSGVLSHLSGLVMPNASSAPAGAVNGLGHEMSQRLGKFETNGTYKQGSGNHQHLLVEPVDSEWWTLQRLEEIERLVHPPLPTAPAKKARIAAGPTYSSATQSYTAKIVTPPSNRRSFSTSSANFPTYSESNPIPRPQSPPPPPVDWATAAHELSKLIIPSDRPTQSCKPEDLNAEATRARRDRQSAVGLPTQLPPKDGKRMQLRDRKPRPVKYVSDEEEDKPASGPNRRKTLAGVTALSSDVLLPAAGSVPTTSRKPTKPKARRLSVASSATSANDDRITESNPTSTVTNQSHRDIVSVKKTRVPSGPCTDGAKARSVKQTPSIPRVSSGNNTVVQPQLGSSSARISDGPPLSENADLKSKDVDGISAGMKKMNIKLNMPSIGEQHSPDSKAANVAPTNTRKPKSTGTKAAKGRAVVTNTLREQRSTPKTPISDPSDISAETLPLPTAPTPSSSTSSITGTPSEPQALLTSIFRPAQTFGNKDPTLPSFLPPSAPAIPAPAPLIESPGTGSHETIQGERQNSQLNTATIPNLPSPPISPEALTPTTLKRTRKDLPVFTSTSAITFSRPDVSPSVGQAPETDVSTVKSTVPPLEEPVQAGPINKEPQFIFSQKALLEHSSLGQSNGEDIWDLHESPQQPRATENPPALPHND